MKPPNLRITKPRNTIILPVQPKIILELFAVVEVAVVFGKGGFGVGVVDHVPEGVGFGLLDGGLNARYHRVNEWDGM